MTDTHVHTVVPEAATDPSRTAQPIIAGFYPDPTICRVGDEYFLANSSFEYFPGVPVFRSDDLLSWTQVGHILDRRSQFVDDLPGPSKGIYAPTLRHHDGRFWLVTTNISDSAGGQLLVTADTPEGPWSEPLFIRDAIGIDPDICWDEDGTCFLTWKVLDLIGDAGEGGIEQAPLDVSTGQLLEPPYPVWQGTGMMAAEGPHLYRIGEYWYILLAEGGTERGHSVTIARSTSPRGPFEACPSNPILTHRSTGHPIQNVGHADLVQTTSGEWAAVFLGTRPAGSTPGFHTIGRETFLAGIDWVDGWPVFDLERYTPAPHDHGFRDDFDEERLHLRWVTPDGDPAVTATPLADGGVELHERSGAPALCARVRDLGWIANARFNESGAFQLRIDPRHWFGLRLENQMVVAEAQIGDALVALGSRSPRTADVTLRIEAQSPASPAVPRGHGGPDDIVLSVVDGAGAVELARLDGRYLSTEVAAGFTGRMLALCGVGEGSVLRSVEYAPGG